MLIPVSVAAPRSCSVLPQLIDCSLLDPSKLIQQQQPPIIPGLVVLRRLRISYQQTSRNELQIVKTHALGDDLIYQLALLSLFRRFCFRIGGFAMPLVVGPPRKGEQSQVEGGGQRSRTGSCSQTVSVVADGILVRSGTNDQLNRPALLTGHYQIPKRDPLSICSS